MPLFFLRYIDSKARTIGAVIVDEFDPILARHTADELGLSFPGPCSAEKLDPADVPPELIGRKLTRRDIGRLVSAGPKKPPAASVRRDSKRRQRLARRS
jgi:hypothetical protein